MKEFIEKIKRLGVCEQYADKVERIGSRKSMLDVALSAGALTWVCEMIARGELPPEKVRREFAPFLDGRYVRDKEIDGYSSTLWCYTDDYEIKIDSTAALIICCNKTIIVDRPICELYIVNSNVVIRGKGIAKVHLYNSSVVNPDERVIVESQKEY